MSFIKLKECALLLLPNLYQKLKKHFKTLLIMKNVHSKLAIAKNVIVSFENSNQERKGVTESTWICTQF